MQKKLGYRLVLSSIDIGASASAGGALTLKLDIKNTGYAAPAHDYQLLLVLRKGTTTVELPVDLVDTNRTKFW